MVTASEQKERLEILDALRGFALLGILLANILYWSGWSAMTLEQKVAFAGADAVEWQYRFHHLFIDGKFYTIFSLLFGAGFALQIARLSSRGVDGLRIYRRRVLVLLGMGIVHSLLIWDGDILTLYALLGLLLPFFFRWSERQLLITASILIFVVPIAGAWAFARLGWEPHQYLFAISNSIAESLGADTSPDKALEWFRRDDVAGWASWQLSGTPYSWALRIESWRIPKVLGIMLIGLVVGRQLASDSLLGNRRLLWQVLASGLAIGLPASVAYALIPDLGQEDWLSAIGTVPLALAYAAAFVLVWPRARPLLKQFGPVGRMALTSYLTHSLLGVIFFFGIGFGLAGAFGPLAFYAIALLIFSAQVLFSKWWLRRHEQGPMEAFWRRATYAPLVHPAGA
ncbi:DUF418 domain-containing protein [Qipengyuania gaetbuli]|uniref:DUF418 domain-containing protein n=1 Tax=Qipengyuania gaetbuli TaxID=266952 RepID=UPI001C99CF94|nr:DUF418 domain-containing protein [Qipengyuania gaetbuli]MBY6016169.1 DUF418 domain-containing protein [Qipengyuania gaetbuli]